MNLRWIFHVKYTSSISAWLPFSSDSFEFMQERPGASVEGAMLVRVSGEEDAAEARHKDDVVCSVDLHARRVLGVFERHEEVLGGDSRTIPFFSFVSAQGAQRYCFYVGGATVITDDRRYYHQD